MNFKKQFQLFVEDISDNLGNSFASRYTRPILLAIGLGVICAASFGGVRWYYAVQAERLGGSLSEIFLKFHTAHESVATDWAAFEKDFLAGQLGNSQLQNSDYFKLLSVNLLVHQGKKDEARAVMGELATKTGKTFFTPLLQIKYALMLLDSADENSQTDGLALLSAVVEDKKVLGSDMAQYEKGRYYFLRSDFPTAKEIWQELVDTQTMNQKELSVWARLAEQKLNQIP
jgi:hypothetical protein